ncbi:PAXI1-like protein [Mya arenaria]|uniref:PAX-interacting protein 1 n=1 Tax=Mya arenaria TaxID=6604 RepID=A0ABY7E0E2_MYAAR|nr:PAXI1-like protein [Mya arenaria]
MAGSISQPGDRGYFIEYPSLDQIVNVAVTGKLGGNVSPEIFETECCDCNTDIGTGLAVQTLLVATSERCGRSVTLETLELRNETMYLTDGQMVGEPLVPSTLQALHAILKYQTTNPPLLSLGPFASPTPSDRLVNLRIPEDTPERMVSSVEATLDGGLGNLPFSESGESKLRHAFRGLLGGPRSPRGGTWGFPEGGFFNTGAFSNISFGFMNFSRCLEDRGLPDFGPGGAVGMVIETSPYSWAYLYSTARRGISPVLLHPDSSNKRQPDCGKVVEMRDTVVCQQQFYQQHLELFTLTEALLCYKVTSGQGQELLIPTEALQCNKATSGQGQVHETCDLMDHQELFTLTEALQGYKVTSSQVPPPLLVSAPPPASVSAPPSSPTAMFRINSHSAKDVYTSVITMTAEGVELVPDDLFKDVTFYIVGEISEDVIELLTRYKGKRDTYLSEVVSHVIADDVDNHEYQEARELFELPCVMLEEKDWLSVWGMIVYNGGRCHATLSNKCTHLITANMEGEKYLEALKHEDTIKMVTPDWVSESVGKGGKQDEAIYHPKLVVYPKPPSPPKPELPPKQEQMEIQTAQVSTPEEMTRLPVPQGSVERRSPSEMYQPGSRPGTPGSASTKEALAKLVSNRMHEIPMPRHQMPPHSSPMGQFPMPPGPHMDYPKLVGMEQIAVWKKVIEQHGGQVDLSYSNRVTHVLCANQKNDVFHLALRDHRRMVTAFWLNDVLLKKKMLPPWQALHLPLLYSEDGQRPCSDQIISITNFDGDDRTRVKQMINALGAKYTGFMTRTNSVLVCKGPEGVKYKKAKEWGVAVVNVRWLSDLILGHMDALKLPISDKYKTVSKGDEFQIDVSKISHLMETPGKLEEEPTWTGKLAHSAESAKIVSQLGGQAVESPQHCTHIVARSFSRTIKFFIGISVTQHIVNAQWVENSYKQGAFISEASYGLQDPDGEREMKCSLAESLSRARAQPLFAGMTFYITPSVQPPICDLQKIIESAGGTLSKGRRLAAKTIETLKDDKGQPAYVVITCADDIYLCNDLLLKNIKVYTPEFILTGVMRQLKDFSHFQLEVER